MEKTSTQDVSRSEQVCFLSELIGIPVSLREQRIGTLSDFVIVDKDKFAEVTDICIDRPFGRLRLCVPWENVKNFSTRGVAIETAEEEKYAGSIPSTAILLTDHILDKKVLDIEDREVEVAYDLKMARRNGRLYVIEVDLSKYGMLRRMGMEWLGKIIFSSSKAHRDITVPWSYVEPLPEQIGSFKGDLKLKVLKDQFSKIPPVDMADILEELGHEQRMAIFHGLDASHASDTLEELDPPVQRHLVASLTKDKAARLINEMTPGQAADILSALPRSATQALIQLLGKDHALKVQAILETQEEKIGNFAASNYLRFSPEKKVKDARAEFRIAAKSKESINYIYILDKDELLLGVLNLKELLMAEEETALSALMISNIIALKAQDTLKDASELFARYSYRALPVLNDSGKMLGVLPYRDVVNLRHRFMSK